MNKIFELINKEKERQNNVVELIASENFVSNDILKAAGSILTNKYAEGYPGKRYYGGCEYIDEIETIAIENAKKLFNVKYANVQPHSGSSANMAVYMALLNKGDKILSMKLDSGGHLTHGNPKSFSGQDYNFIFYGVDKETGIIDYEELEKIAKTEKPKLIIAGASAYSKIIDFKKIKKIADSINAYFMVDMAHIAGLVATGMHPSPCQIADVITFTTHKTLRGPRGGAILTNDEEIAKKINSALFPGMQGGPLMHIIAAKAICFENAMSDDFKKYQEQTLKNAKALCQTLIDDDFKIISGLTDNHLMLVDVKSSINMTGKEAEAVLESINITCNKNMIPYDEEKPFVTSGIRIGSPAMTSRGLKEDDFVKIGKIISKALKNKDNTKLLDDLKEEVKQICKKYPLWY
ncbi:MAG: serine hydroxymethyltransferase [Bacilli bacterium]|nr:serine hydroxymethyltransferase [Bacilli bacterium]